jgi:hypothetical protein
LARAPAQTHNCGFPAYGSCLGCDGTSSRRGKGGRPLAHGEVVSWRYGIGTILTERTSGAGAMDDEHSPIRVLKQKWNEEDAARDKQEERAKQLFLEQEANRTFAPIEDFLTRLRKVLSAADASAEIDTWEHLGDRRLRRVARILSSNPPRQLRLEFTIQGLDILLHRVIEWVDFSPIFESPAAVIVAVGMWATRLRCPSCPQWCLSYRQDLSRGQMSC